MVVEEREGIIDLVPEREEREKERERERGRMEEREKERRGERESACVFVCREVGRYFNNISSVLQPEYRGLVVSRKRW